jgi:hypothetical protein
MIIFFVVIYTFLNPSLKEVHRLSIGLRSQNISCHPQHNILFKAQVHNRFWTLSADELRGLTAS